MSEPGWMPGQALNIVRDPNPHLGKMQLFRITHIEHRACGRRVGRTPMMFAHRDVWHVFRCDCGELLRVPPTGEPRR